MDKFSQLLLYLPGILIFLAGSGRVRDGKILASGSLERTIHENRQTGKTCEGTDPVQNPRQPEWNLDISGMYGQPRQNPNQTVGRCRLA